MKIEKTNTQNNSNITEEDLQALGDKKQNLRSDGGEDETLRNREQDVDFTGKDLDVPTGSSVEGKAIADEENRLHSQGGEDNEHLEQGSDHLPA